MQGLCWSTVLPSVCEVSTVWLVCRCPHLRCILLATVLRLESTYIPYSRKPVPVVPVTKLVLQLAKLRVNNAGQFRLLWKDSEDSENVCEATLADTFFAHGATKRVYKVRRIFHCKT